MWVQVPTALGHLSWLSQAGLKQGAGWEVRLEPSLANCFCAGPGVFLSVAKYLAYEGKMKLTAFLFIY